MPWLKTVLARAFDVARRQTWTPPDPGDVMALVRDQSRRLVESGEALLEVIVASLQRLQQKLVGETPRARFLWNEISKDKWRPRDEGAISDYVKSYLEDDLTGRGIILKREVQIRRRQGTTPGQDTDIHVTAVVPGDDGCDRDAVSVIIENKGCWHAELMTAMETQLVDRYLDKNQCRTGLYVVAWFHSDAWDPVDKRKPSKLTLDEVKNKLTDQARQLSRDGMTVRSFVLDASI
jgi:hypothetical protein